ncbi:MAG: VCBS repeat-containing protein [Acidobacteria bacterium]|nr:VCBS repeat-containing protein [Acidobacteriota bacterium]
MWIMLVWGMGGCPLTWDQWQAPLGPPWDTNGNGLLDTSDLIGCLFNETDNVTFVNQLLDDSFVHGQGLEIADIDGDLDMDVMVAYSLSDQVVAYINGGDSTGGGTGTTWTTTEISLPGAIVATDVAIADFDGINGPDVAAVGLFDRNIGFSSAGEVTWYANPGAAGSWTTNPITGLTFWGALRLEAGDLTGEGRPDLVVAAIEATDGSGTPQPSGIWWFENQGGAPLVWSTRRAVDGALQHCNRAVIVDVDQDGILDIVGAGTYADELAWYENTRTGINGNPIFSKHLIATLDQPLDIMATQMDGDPTPEVVVGYAHINGFGALAWFDAPPDSTQLWTIHIIDLNYGVGEVHFCAGLFNNDSLTDIATTNFDISSGHAYLRDGSSWSPIIPLVPAPFGMNHITCGDVTGDGRPDLLTTTYGNSSVDQVDIWINTPASD